MEVYFKYHQRQIALDKKKLKFYQMVNEALGWVYIEEDDFYDSIEEYLDFCEYCKADTSALKKYITEELEPLDKSSGDDFDVVTLDGTYLMTADFSAPSYDGIHRPPSTKHRVFGMTITVDYFHDGCPINVSARRD